jgi:hypothetical protein
MWKTNEYMDSIYLALVMHLISRCALEGSEATRYVFLGENKIQDENGESQIIFLKPEVTRHRR